MARRAPTGPWPSSLRSELSATAPWVASTWAARSASASSSRFKIATSCGAMPVTPCSTSASSANRRTPASLSASRATNPASTAGSP